MNNYYHSLYKNILLDFSRNKVRTFLTSLGITIGVFAVVMLIALGLGLRNYISGQFKDLGANVVAIFPGGGPQDFSSLAGSIRLDMQDLRSLQKINNVDYTVPAYISETRIATSDSEDSGTVFGTSEDYVDLFSLKVLAGEAFNRADVSASSKVAIIAESLADKLFEDPEDAVGQIVRVKNLRVKIIGLVANVGNPGRDNALIIPYTTSFISLNPDKEFFAIYLGVGDEDQVADVKTKAEEVLLDRYDAEQVSVTEPSEVLESLDQIFAMLNIVLVALGSISLIVGGVGIMNIMYANVTERTKEIGIRRAIGASGKQVLLQFMLESTALSLLGGLSGLLLSTIAVLIIRNFFPVEINLLSVVIAIGFSSFIGIFFGSFPARRAANLTPIEAIRY